MLPTFASPMNMSSTCMSGTFPSSASVLRFFLTLQSSASNSFGKECVSFRARFSLWLTGLSKIMLAYFSFESYVHGSVLQLSGLKIDLDGFVFGDASKIRTNTTFLQHMAVAGPMATCSMWDSVDGRLTSASKNSMPHFQPPQTPSSRLPPHGWDFRLRPPVSPTSPTSFSRGRSFTETTRSWPTPNRLRSPRPPGPIPQCSSQRPLKVSRRRQFSTSHLLRSRLAPGGSFLHVCLLPALNNFVISFCASVPAPVVELCADFVGVSNRSVSSVLRPSISSATTLSRLSPCSPSVPPRLSARSASILPTRSSLSVPRLQHLPACSASILPHLSPPASHFFNASHWPHPSDLFFLGSFSLFRVHDTHSPQPSAFWRFVPDTPVAGLPLDRTPTAPTCATKKRNLRVVSEFCHHVFPRFFPVHDRECQLIHVFRNLQVYTDAPLWTCSSSVAGAKRASRFNSGQTRHAQNRRRGLLPSVPGQHAVQLSAGFLCTSLGPLPPAQRSPPRILWTPCPSCACAAFITSAKSL